ncbi:diuretic hormone 44 [Anabrus simplex]|uniref:diuretic hormone 44 n=1 Tax=Anabrus simplex TaxID=316456 RepID=UPI0034DD54DA
MPLLLTVLLAMLACCCTGSSAYYEQGPMEQQEQDSTAVLSNYRPQNWDAGLLDPRFYLLSELESDNDQASRRVKRTGSQSLSIVAPLDVLRQRLLLELNRRRMRQSEGQIEANRKLLTSIGKRSDRPIQRALWPSSWDERLAEDMA